MTHASAAFEKPIDSITHSHSMASARRRQLAASKTTRTLAAVVRTPPRLLIVSPPTTNDATHRRLSEPVGGFVDAVRRSSSPDIGRRRLLGKQAPSPQSSLQPQPPSSSRNSEDIDGYRIVERLFPLAIESDRCSSLSPTFVGEHRRNQLMHCNRRSGRLNESSPALLPRVDSSSSGFNRSAAQHPSVMQNVGQLCRSLLYQSSYPTTAMLYLTSKLSDYLRNAINMPTAAAVVEAAAAAVAAPETAAVAALAAAAEVAAAAAAAAETVPSIGRQTYVLPVGVVDIYQICCA